MQIDCVRVCEFVVVVLCYFTRVFPTGETFLPGTLRIILCELQDQGESKPDDSLLEERSIDLPPETKLSESHI